MSDPDRLAEITARFHAGEELRQEDVGWLIADATIKLGLLARLEWAGQPTPGTRIGTQPRCPVCRETEPPHDRGCWLASALGR